MSIKNSKWLFLGVKREKAKKNNLEQRRERKKKLAQLPQGRHKTLAKN